MDRNGSRVCVMEGDFSYKDAPPLKILLDNLSNVNWDKADKIY